MIKNPKVYILGRKKIPFHLDRTLNICWYLFFAFVDGGDFTTNLSVRLEEPNSEAKQKVAKEKKEAKFDK